MDFQGILGFPDNTNLSRDMRIRFTMNKIQERNMTLLEHDKMDMKCMKLLVFG